MLVPKVRVRDNLQLTQRSYRIHLAGNPVAEGVLFVERILAMGHGGKRLKLPGRRVDDRVYGEAAVWVDPEYRAQAQSLGYEVLSPSAALARHLHRVVRDHSPELLNRDVTRALIEELRPHAPAVVEETLSGAVPMGNVQEILRRLLFEDVPIRQLGNILEVLTDQTRQRMSLDQQLEMVRRRLARTLCTRYVSGDGVLYFVDLERDLEEYIQEQSIQDGDDWTLRASKDTHARLVNLLNINLDVLRDAGRSPVLVVAPAIRRALKRWSIGRIPVLSVLSQQELVAGVPTHCVATVRTTDLRATATRVPQSVSHEDVLKSA